MSDPLFGNKLAAAGLTALLLFFGLQQLGHGLYAGGGHGGGHGGEESSHPFPQYPVEFETAAGGSESGGGEEGPSFMQLLVEASPSSGERRVALCQSCHSFEEGGPNGTGPNLYDIVGREVASVPGFNYSGALQEFGGEWTFERLSGYLENSQQYVPGTAMAQRIGKDEQRAQIIAYLRTLSNDPVPLPEVEAPAEEDAAQAEAEGGEEEAPADGE